jgi:hypothetical protein
MRTLNPRNGQSNDGPQWFDTEGDVSSHGHASGIPVQAGDMFPSRRICATMFTIEIGMPTLLNCPICGRPYTLEECTVDERGRAVHYQCLADQIVRQDNVVNPKPN